MKNTITSKTLSVIFTFLLGCSAIQAAHAAAETLQNGTGPVEEGTVLDAPDLGVLEHIQEEYVSGCRTVPGQNESWQGFETNLDTLNAGTFAVVKDLAHNNKKIRKAVQEISRALAKINNAVINKDIRRTKRKVLKDMESLKKQLAGTRKSIDDIKVLVDKSQQTVGGTYCRVDQYVNTYLAQAEEHEAEQRADVAATDTNTAARMSRKREELFQVMQEFDHYFGMLEQLFEQADHKLMLIDSVQKNIVAFVDTKCRNRATPCIYQSVSDLRFNEVQLADIMGKIEDAFSRLVQTAQANFSGSKNQIKGVRDAAK